MHYSPFEIQFEESRHSVKEGIKQSASLSVKVSIPIYTLLLQKKIIPLFHHF
jgi:hypothetical protein